MIYLDHASTSPMTPPVVEAMWPFLTKNFGNASSRHDLGHIAAQALDESRQVIADIFRCQPDEVVFTSGGTESNNYAIKGVALAEPRERIIVTTQIEHEAVLEPVDYLLRHHGFSVRYVSVDHEGRVDLDSLNLALSPGVTLCTIQYANSEIGTIQDIEAIAEICDGHHVPFHTDAVQAAGMLSLDTNQLGADMVSISAHKFGGPKGVGALIRHRDMTLEPLIHGGGQERGERSGTSNVAGVVGLATALRMAENQRQAFVADVTPLRDELFDQILQRIPSAQATGSRDHRLPHHVSVTLGSISGESMVVDLGVKGIACSSGSACAEGKDEPSYVLQAIGIDDAVAQTAIRFTLGPETTREEVAFVLNEIPNFFERASTD